MITTRRLWLPERCFFAARAIELKWKRLATRKKRAALLGGSL